MLSYFILLYSNFSFATLILKKTRSQISVCCPRWEDYQGITTGATDARCRTEPPFSENLDEEARDRMTTVVLGQTIHRLSQTGVGDILLRLRDLLASSSPREYSRTPYNPYLKNSHSPTTLWTFPIRNFAMILFGQLSMPLRTHMPISSNVRRADLMQTFPKGMGYKGFDCRGVSRRRTYLTKP